MQPTQLYETTIYDRETSAGVGFVVVPARSIAQEERPDAADLAARLGLQADADDPFGRGMGLAPVEAWSLPFLIDAALGRFPDLPVASVAKSCAIADRRRSRST